jgi:hypothetical protein
VELVGTMDVTDDRDTLLAIATSVLERYHPEVGAADRSAMAEVVIAKRVALLLRPQRRVTWDHRKLGGAY